MTTEHYGMQDIIIATAELVGRTGASEFDVGYVNDEAELSEDAGWYAVCMWQGVRLTCDDRKRPEEACLALSMRLLAGAICKCLRPVTLDDKTSGCRWTLNGPKWTPGCTVDAITVSGNRGDVIAIEKALSDRMGAMVMGDRPPPSNRAERRGQYQHKGKKRRR